MRIFYHKKHKSSELFGLRYTRFYSTWKNLFPRCLNPKNPSFKYYGGKGITIDKRWFTFKNFIDDMYEEYAYHIEKYGDSRKNCQLDRIDNNKGYSKENCRWVTAKKNCLNRKEYKRGNAVFLTYNNITDSKSGWARRLNITNRAFHDRYNNWPFDKVFTTPKKR